LCYFGEKNPKSATRALKEKAPRFSLISYPDPGWWGLLNARFPESVFMVKNRNPQPVFYEKARCLYRNETVT